MVDLIIFIVRQKINKMAYFQNKKIKDMIYEEIGKGNQGAINILKKLSEMSQDDLNNALANFKPTPNDINQILKELIADEYEAIEGYNKAIMILKANNNGESEYKIGQLQTIINEELKHISMLKSLNNVEGDINERTQE